MNLCLATTVAELPLPSTGSGAPQLHPGVGWEDTEVKEPYEIRG